MAGVGREIGFVVGSQCDADTDRVGSDKLVHGFATAVAQSGPQAAETFRVGFSERQHGDSACQQRQCSEGRP